MLLITFFKQLNLFRYWYNMSGFEGIKLVRDHQDICNTDLYLLGTLELSRRKSAVFSVGWSDLLEDLSSFYRIF